MLSICLVLVNPPFDAVDCPFIVVVKAEVEMFTTDVSVIRNGVYRTTATVKVSVVVEKIIVTTILLSVATTRPTVEVLLTVVALGMVTFVGITVTIMS